MKSSKAQILAKFHKIPVLRFEDQELTFISRALMQIDADGVEQLRRLSRNMVLEGLQREQFPF